MGIDTLLLTAALFAPAEARAPDMRIVVVVSEKNELKDITPETLSAVFSGQTSSAAAQNLMPLDLSESDIRDQFYQQLLGKNRNQMRAYWSRMVFTSRGRPPQEMNAEQIAALLKSNPRAIAYLPRYQVTSGMRIVWQVPAQP